MILTLQRVRKSSCTSATSLNKSSSLPFNYITNSSDTESLAIGRRLLLFTGLAFAQHASLSIHTASPPPPPSPTQWSRPASHYHFLVTPHLCGNSDPQKMKNQTIQILAVQSRRAMQGCIDEETFPAKILFITFQFSYHSLGTTEFCPCFLFSQSVNCLKKI